MKNSSPSFAFAHLPVTRDLALAYALSLVVTLMMGVASAAGLLYTTNLYPTQEPLKTFVANDVVNLFIGLPILLGSMWLARGDHLPHLPGSPYGWHHRAGNP